MITTPQFKEPTQLIKKLRRGLISAHDWVTQRNLSYYRQAYRAGTLKVVAGKEVTKQPARCGVCEEFHLKGIRRFWMDGFDNRSFWVQFDAECLKKITVKPRRKS